VISGKTENLIERSDTKRTVRSGTKWAESY